MVDKKKKQPPALGMKKRQSKFGLRILQTCESECHYHQPKHRTFDIEN